MNPADVLAKMMFLLALFLVIAGFLTGCGSIASFGDTNNGVDAMKIEQDAKNDFDGSSKAAYSDKEKITSKEQQESSGNSLIINIRNLLGANNRPTVAGNAQTGAANIRKATAPIVEIPAPELTNVNKYAAALEEKLLRRYNNTPDYAGNISKVQLLPVGKPEVSLDGKKLRMNWSQVVYDIWGKRIGELEKEYYVVTFGDGKPVMQRTRPTITVGLNNEGGYAEFDRVRGGKLSGIQLKSGPDMFDVPASEKTGLLEDNLAAKDSVKAPYLEYELPEIRNFNPPKSVDAPVIPPAQQPMQALVVLEEI